MGAQERQTSAALIDPAPVDLGREIRSDLHLAERKTFASGRLAFLCPC